MRRSAIVAGAFALTACSAPPPSQRWSGELVTVTSDDGVELCGGSTAFLDAYVEHIHSFWGNTTPVVPIQLELRDTGDSDARGRARDSRAWAGDEAAVLHELVHLVTEAESDFGAPSLTEGIATAVSPRDPSGMWSPPPQPEEFAFLPRNEFGSQHYQPSAQLARFLIQERGVATLREAYEDSDLTDSAEEIEGAYLSAYGDTLYDTFDAFEVAPQCGLIAWECEPSLHPTLQLPVDIESPEDCTAAPDWVGASGDLNDGWYPHRRFLLTIDEETQIMAHADNARVLRTTCNEKCGWAGDELPHIELMARPAANGALFPRTLAPGVHTFHITPLEPSLPFSVRIERVDV